MLARLLPGSVGICSGVMSETMEVAYAVYPGTPRPEMVDMRANMSSGARAPSRIIAWPRLTASRNHRGGHDPKRVDSGADTWRLVTAAIVTGRWEAAAKVMSCLPHS